MSIARSRCWLERMGETHCLYHLVIQCLQDDPETRHDTSEICSTLKSLSEHYRKDFEVEDVLKMYEVRAILALGNGPLQSYFNPAWILQLQFNGHFICMLHIFTHFFALKASSLTSQAS